jgi:hypothetical protein
MGRAVARHYAVTFQGDASPGLVAAFPDLAVWSREHRTTLSGALLDEAALVSVIERVQALGLAIVDVHPIDTTSRSGSA